MLLFLKNKNRETEGRNFTGDLWHPTTAYNYVI